jgi:hypothetical protein
MWTAFVWGFGVSCGASFGLILFFILFWSLEWVTGRAKKKADDLGFNRKSLEALVKRNELTVEMISHLSAIAAASERYEDSLKTES